MDDDALSAAVVATAGVVAAPSAPAGALGAGAAAATAAAPAAATALDGARCGAAGSTLAPTLPPPSPPSAAAPNVPALVPGRLASAGVSQRICAPTAPRDSHRGTYSRGARSKSSSFLSTDGVLRSCALLTPCPRHTASTAACSRRIAAAKRAGLWFSRMLHARGALGRITVTTRATCAPEAGTSSRSLPRCVVGEVCTARVRTEARARTFLRSRTAPQWLPCHHGSKAARAGCTPRRLTRAATGGRCGPALLPLAALAGLGQGGSGVAALRGQ